MSLEVVGTRESTSIGDRQIIEILVADGYRPDVIEARAGVPIRVVFKRQDDHPCSDRVVFSRPRIERHLAPRSVTVVDLPAVASGQIRFTCGMGRYRGRIELVPADTRSAGRQRLEMLTVVVIALAGVAATAALAGSVTGGSAVMTFAVGLLIADTAALVAVVRRTRWHVPHRS